jgi:thiol-disulfide isomerase/thioredoxin
MDFEIKSEKDINELQETMKKKDVIVLYYAVWCGACKGMMPEWNNFLKVCEKKKISIGMIESNYLPLVKFDSNINGFPTIKKYKTNGSVIDYEGPRNAKAFLKFTKPSKKKPSKKKPSKKKPSKKKPSKKKPSKKKPSKKKPSKKKPSKKK